MDPFKGEVFATPFGGESETFQTPVMENQKGLDSAKAHELVEECLNEVRATLEKEQLVGVGASGSRRFILRYLGSNLLRSVLRGETSFFTTYEELKGEWEDRGESGIHAGTKNITPDVTCSLWAQALHPNTVHPKTKQKQKTWFQPSRGDHAVRLRLHRPDDDEDRKTGTAGRVGFVVEIFTGKDLVPVVSTDKDVQPVSDYWTLPAPSDRNQKRQEQIERIAARLRDALAEQPTHVLEVLDTHPEKFSYEHGMVYLSSYWSSYWSSFRRNAEKAAAILVVIFLGSVAAVIVSAPQEARAQMAKGWKELKAGFEYSYGRWCPGCDEPNRHVHWEFEHPEAYYTPGSWSLRGEKSQAFTLSALPASALPTVHSEENHVEVVADPNDALRVRIAVTPVARVRRHDTKFYINFGDDPAIRGDMNKMIAVGPAALMEHVFPRPGLYKIRVNVARRMSESVRAGDPSHSEHPILPPSENQMYVVVEVITINLRVGE
jgi:hypothetical protein